MPRSDPAKVRLLCLDVDGVLTDGSVLIDDAGVETKRFFVRDGTAIRMWQRHGGMIAIITGRRGPALRHRADELGIEHLLEGVDRKGEAFDALLEALGVEAVEAAMVGDDLPDLPILERCGYPVAVADAAAEIVEAACHVTTATGGRGAVREVVELLLKAKGEWGPSVDHYRERG